MNEAGLRAAFAGGFSANARPNEVLGTAALATMADATPSVKPTVSVAAAMAARRLPMAGIVGFVTKMVATRVLPLLPHVSSGFPAAPPSRGRAVWRLAGLGSALAAIGERGRRHAFVPEAGHLLRIKRSDLWFEASAKMGRVVYDKDGMVTGPFLLLPDAG